ncbi:MAG: hypothetical protein JW723_11815 [Bacteroidales bacterium]|nr:hypothetical protein [Bacteroidales bacterium]
MRRISIGFWKNRKEYLLTYLLFALSSSPFLASNVIYLVISLLIGILLFFATGKRVNIVILYLFIFISILTIANIILFKFFSFRTTTGNFVRFLMPYFVLSIIGPYYPKYYVNVIKTFLIISFIFYIPANIVPGFNEMLQIIPKTLGTDPKENYHFIIYTIEYATPFKSNLPIYRNSGPTGEPGEFAGFIILAIIFELLQKRTFWTKSNAFLTIGLLTTFSTAGYIAFFILFSAYFLMFGKIFNRFVLFPLSLLVAYNIYFNFAFMTEKVDQQLTMITEATSLEEIPRDARLPNLLQNLMDSFESPLFGMGRNFATRYPNIDPENLDAFSNTLFDFPSDFGWPFFIFYLYLMFKSFQYLLMLNKQNKKFAYIIILVILTLATSQGFLMTSVFISLIYIKPVLQKYIAKNLKLLNIKQHKKSSHAYLAQS